MDVAAEEIRPRISRPVELVNRRNARAAEGFADEIGSVAASVRYAAKLWGTSSRFVRSSVTSEFRGTLSSSRSNRSSSAISFNLTSGAPDGLEVRSEESESRVDDGLAPFVSAVVVAPPLSSSPPQAVNHVTASKLASITATTRRDIIAYFLLSSAPSIVPQPRRTSRKSRLLDACIFVSNWGLCLPRPICPMPAEAMLSASPEGKPAPARDSEGACGWRPQNGARRSRRRLRRELGSEYLKIACAYGGEYVTRTEIRSRKKSRTSELDLLLTRTRKLAFDSSAGVQVRPQRSTVLPSVRVASMVPRSLGRLLAGPGSAAVPGELHAHARAVRCRIRP